MSDKIYHNGEIGEEYNYSELFVRNVSVALGRTLSKHIRWINHFEDKKMRVLVPFYYGFIQESFMIDTFVDDILGKRIELDTTKRPRGILRLRNWSPISSEFANPNQYLTQKANINSDIRNIISKVRAIPIQINYDVEILLSSQADVEKCMQKIMNSLFNYKFMRIEYYGLQIDCNFEMPDDTTIEISPDSVDFGQDDRFPKISFSLTVKSYYPSFKVDVDDLQVCDNDDDVDWELLDLPKPTEDYIDMVRKYHNRISNESNVRWDETFVSRVFWKAYLYEAKRRENGEEPIIKPIGKNNKEEDIAKKSRKRPE